MQLSFFRKLLKKYSGSNASPAERYVVDAWYKSFDDDEKKSTDELTQQQLEATRLRILNKIMPPPVIVPWFKTAWARAAAIIAVPAFAALFYFQYGHQHPTPATPATDLSFVTHTGEVKKLTLPDSTLVWLNANSELHLKSDYGKADRTIALTGEAFFDVKHDARHPFNIHTGDLTIKDIGTSFNVRAYAALKTINVAVNTGKVEVSRQHKQLALLTPGQGLSIDTKTYLAAAFTHEAANTNGWTTGKTVLTKASFEELTQAIYNIYGMRLFTTDAKVRAFKYNLTIHTNHTLKDAMEVICSILNKKYKKEGPDGIMIY